MSAERCEPVYEPGSDDETAPSLSLPELASAARVPQGALRQARELGLLPPLDATGRWPAAAARDIQQQWPQIATALQAAQELGAERCAELLTRATGLTVRSAHVETLADRGMLQSTRIYRRRPLYRVADIQALADDPLSRALLSEIVS